MTLVVSAPRSVSEVEGLEVIDKEYGLSVTWTPGALFAVLKLVDGNVVSVLLTVIVS